MDDIDRLADIIKEAVERMGGNSRPSESYASLPAEEKQKKLLADTNKRFKELNEQLVKGKKQYVNLAKDIELLDDALSDLDDGIDKLDLEMQRSALAQKVYSESAKKAGMDLTKVVAGSVVKGIANSTKSLITSLQSGGSGIQLAAELMSTALDTGQSVISGSAKTAETLGSAMQITGGKTGKFGAALSVGASVVEGFSQSLTGLLKQGIDLLAKEAEGRIKAFNESTAAGAVFAKGMDDMSKYAAQSGLTIAQFSNVVKTNSNLLADAGYTVADGAKIVAGVTGRFAVQTGKSGQTLQREMLNLGIGFEEQAGLTARIVGDLKRTGGQATNGQLAEATVGMAKNMKAVADIMGEEYKGRQEAAKKAAEQYAFQNKVNEIARRTNDPGLPERVRQAMSLMSDSNRRAAIQATVLGGAVTDVSANLTGGADAGRDFANALTTGRTSMQDLTRGTAMLNDRFQLGTNETGMALSRLAIATGDQADVAQAFSDQQQDSYKANSQNINKALSDAQKLSGTQGGLQGELLGVEIQAQSLKIAIQKELTPSISRFATVANQVLDSVVAAVGAVAKGGSKPSALSGAGNLVSKTGVGTAIGGAALFGLGALASATGVGAVAGVPMMSVGGTMMGAGLAGAGVGEGMTMAGYANGGISSGPLSGYQVQLHGTEAVVPLPDGKSIPVEMKDSSNAATAKLMSQVVEELQRGNQLSATNFQNLIRAMKDGNNLTSGILQNSY